MNSLSARVTARTRAAGNIVCFGLEPIPSRLPLEGAPEQAVERFGMGFLEACQRRGTLPAAVKPNIACFEALGPVAFAALARICSAWKQAGAMVILDAKRGDIARTSSAYAQAAFGAFQADVVTVA